MAVIGDALRQAFMSKCEYESLRAEDRAWAKLHRPIAVAAVAVVSVAVVVSAAVALKIAFPADASRRPFCTGDDRAAQFLQIDARRVGSDSFRGAFHLTDQETVDYFNMVLLAPWLIVFWISIVYLIAGMVVAFSYPERHGLLILVENSCCASRRDGARCLSIINGAFAIIFGLLALFLGSSLLTLGNSCAAPLFWCYEVASWGLIVLFGGNAFFLRRQAAAILDDRDFSSRNLGLEMLEASSPVLVTPEVERRVSEGFKAWMGSSLLSSDDEDEPDGPYEVPLLART